VKTSTDPRHRQRLKLFKQLFRLGFNLKNPPASIKFILPHLKKIDQLINRCAPEWPIEKLNKIDLAILRLALYELEFEKR
jgi:N utilization substance protein B